MMGNVWKPLVAAVFVLGLVPVCEAAVCEEPGWRERWNQSEPGILRTVILPKLTELPDYDHIKDVFEKAIANDPAAARSLMELTGHSNVYAATSSASALGRFPSQETAARLKQVFSTDLRPHVRGGALAGLVRMGDPDAGSLAVQALSDPSLEMQVAGATRLGMLRDARFGPALFAYYTAHREHWELLESIGCLGDPPGSTVVRDGLLAEANNKKAAFRVRLAAAVSLEQMGHVQLVKGILDRDKGNMSHRKLGGVEFTIHELATKRGVTIKNQADVDSLLRDADLDNYREDQWEHPIRVKFISEGVIRAISDGPDGLPDTPDDLSTAESYGAWCYRVFRDQYEP